MVTSQQTTLALGSWAYAGAWVKVVAIQLFMGVSAVNWQRSQMCCILAACCRAKQGEDCACRMHTGGAADGEAHLPWHVHHEPARQSPGGHRCAARHKHSWLPQVSKASKAPALMTPYKAPAMVKSYNRIVS